MVHFDCPKCGKRLDVDSGFRGSVARCDACGALISVPTKDAPTASETVQRPSRPPRPEEFAEPPLSTGPVRRNLSVRIAAVVLLGALVVTAAALVWTGVISIP